MCLLLMWNLCKVDLWVDKSWSAFTDRKSENLIGKWLKTSFVIFFLIVLWRTYALMYFYVKLSLFRFLCRFTIRFFLMTKFVAKSFKRLLHVHCRLYKRLTLTREFKVSNEMSWISLLPILIKSPCNNIVSVSGHV